VGGPDTERFDDLLGERSRAGRSLGLAGFAGMKGFFILDVEDWLRNREPPALVNAGSGEFSFATFRRATNGRFPCRFDKKEPAEDGREDDASPDANFSLAESATSSHISMTRILSLIAR
jgi:hypothetical protein